MYRRQVYATLADRLREPRRFLQILAGPRQVGKTTLVRQIMDAEPLHARYASADETTLRDRIWIEQQWELGRRLAREAEPRTGALLVLDEVQKIPGWSDVVKALWDRDTASGLALKVVILGSSPLLVQSGLTESLAGRFESVSIPHWSFHEMHAAFGWDLDTYIFYGGYPGAAPLIDDPERWVRYISDSLVETTISRDILLLSRIEKPALLRRLFYLCCEYSGQILSYQKMIGQLQDVGNTTTLAHYLQLLAGVGMVAGLQKYAGQAVRRRGSSPKLQVFNTALLSATIGADFDQVRNDPDRWGRYVESAVGAHLANAAANRQFELYYWRHRSKEVDFVLKRGDCVTAIEVKSGRRPTAMSGMTAFTSMFKPRRTLLVGTAGLALEEFLLIDPAAWVEESC